MASQAQPPLWRQTVRHGARRSGALIGAMAIVVVTVMIAVCLISYHPGDPSLSTAAAGPARNLLGSPGAMIADALLAMLGWPVVLLLPFGLVLAARLWRDVAPGRWGRMVLKGAGGTALMATAFAFVSSSAVNALPAGYGGAIGVKTASFSVRVGRKS